MARALNQMGYDAVVVGENELSAGKQFLSELLKKYKLKLISSNLNFKGVSKYVLKEINNCKVAITAVSPLKTKTGTDLLVSDPKQALGDVIKEINSRKVDLIILVSSLSREETLNLMNDFPELNLAVDSGINYSNVDKEEVEGKILLYPVYQSKVLSDLSMEVTAGKISNVSLNHQKLSTDKAEDPKLKKILPECFQDNDCPSNPELIRKCENPGTNSSCKYLQPEKVDVQVISDFNCLECNLTLTRAIIKNLFLGANFIDMDYQDSSSQELISKYDIKTIPAFIFSKSIEKYDDFSKKVPAFDLVQDKYLLKPAFSGVFIYLDREKKNRLLDVFINPNDPGSVDIVKGIKTMFANSDYDINIHFIINPRDPDVHISPYLTDELLRIISIKRLYPEKLWDYLIIRLSDINSTWWQKPMEELGIDLNKVYEFSVSQQAQELLKNNQQLSLDLGVAVSAVLIENRRIFSLASGTNARGYKLEDVLGKEKNGEN